VIVHFLDLDFVLREEVFVQGTEERLGFVAVLGVEVVQEQQEIQTADCCFRPLHLGSLEGQVLELEWQDLLHHWVQRG
jgi:hypothetical protein